MWYPSAAPGTLFGTEQLFNFFVKPHPRTIPCNHPGGLMPQSENSSSKLDRRKFLKTAATTAGVMFIKPSLVHGTAANSAVRVGLLGCGGRGTEDATNLIDTGNARVVALADLFRDQLDAARAHFDQLQQPKSFAAIDPS